MPLREYQCKKCKHRFEKIEKFSDKPLKKCPECSGPLEELISAPAVQFKGSGWYVTDYAKKGTATSASSSESEGASKDATKGSTTEAKETKDSKKDDKPKSETTSKKHKKD
jgi:putative FmdB family regulatory protein